MINFKYQKPEGRTGAVKATVHKDGKLGFSSSASKVMGLDKNRRFKIATNADEESDTNLYFLVVEEEDREGVFTIAKAGSYYYVRVKHILQQMNIEYEKEKVIYDIRKVLDHDNNLSYYQLERRDPIKN